MLTNTLQSMELQKKFMNEYDLLVVCIETSIIYNTQLDHIWTNALFQQYHFQ
jgi:hypothetical protein